MQRCGTATKCITRSSACIEKATTTTTATTETYKTKQKVHNWTQLTWKISFLSNINVCVWLWCVEVEWKRIEVGEWPRQPYKYRQKNYFTFDECKKRFIDSVARLPQKTKKTIFVQSEFLVPLTRCEERRFERKLTWTEWRKETDRKRNCSARFDLIEGKNVLIGHGERKGIYRLMVCSAYAQVNQVRSSLPQILHVTRTERTFYSLYTPPQAAASLLLITSQSAFEWNSFKLNWPRRRAWTQMTISIQFISCVCVRSVESRHFGLGNKFSKNQIN